MKAHTRLRRLPTGISIHADDYDDTQPCAAKDRIYGLLTHPSAACFTNVAVCELGGEQGKDSCWLKHRVEVDAKIAEASRHDTTTKVSYHRHVWIVRQALLPARSCGG